MDSQYLYRPATTTNTGGAVVLCGAERCCLVVQCCGGYRLEEMWYLDVFIPIKITNNFIAQRLGLRCGAVELQKG